MFWFFMQLAMIAGFVTAYPMNWWLIARHERAYVSARQWLTAAASWQSKDEQDKLPRDEEWTVKLALDTDLHCDDGTAVKLIDVVIDPRDRTVTHAVVKPHDGGFSEHLIPVDLIDTSDPESPAVRLTGDMMRRYPNVLETDYLRLGDQPIAEPGWAVGIERVLALPFYSAEFGPGWYDDHYSLTWDRIPAGEVEVRRDSPVVNKDDHRIGHVDGFVCDDDGNITHVAMRHGHFFGRRDLVIPIGKVTRLENDEVRVDLTDQELRQLPDVRVELWHERR